MKVIDLLNRIANGEKVPKKIRYKGFELKRTQSEDVKRLYVDEQCCFFPAQYGFDLNDEIEIIEENKKIEKIGNNNYKWNYVYDKKTPQAIVDNLELVRQKINEILDKVNELENNNG